MESIFKLNKLRRRKLKEMIKVLFPEVKFIFVRNNGVVILRKYWYSSYKSIHVSELCITQIPERLSKFRQGDNLYVPVYKSYLEYIIHSNAGNVINWLYSEFLKIRREPKLEILVKKNSLLLPENSNCETIGFIINQKEKIKKKPVCYRIKAKKIEYIRNLYNSLMNESIIDKFERAKFLLLQS